MSFVALLTLLVACNKDPDESGDLPDSTETETEVANEAPVAAADALTTTEDATVGLNPAANDADADGDALTVTAVGTPTDGGTTLLDGDGTVTYGPPASAQALGASDTATDTFTYTVSDGAATATGTVTITITGSNDAPVGVADGYTVAEGGTLTVAPGAGVVANDVDVDSVAVFSGVGTLPANGTLSLATDGGFTYVHNGGESATDTFTYVPGDGAASGAATTVSLTVTPVNDPPVVDLDGPGGTRDRALDYDIDGSAVLVAAAAATLTDPDSAALTSLTVVVTNGVTGDVLAAVTTGTALSASYAAPSHTLTVSGTGTLAEYQTVLRSVTFASTGRLAPARSLAVTVSDGTATGSATATVTLITSNPPVVTGSTPAEGATGVTVDLAAVSLAFDQAMDPTVGALSFDTGVQLGTLAWSAGNTRVEAPITAGLTAGTLHRMTPTGFTSSRGAALATGSGSLGDGVLDFTTAFATSACGSQGHYVEQDDEDNALFGEGDGLAVGPDVGDLQIGGCVSDFAVEAQAPLVPNDAQDLDIYVVTVTTTGLYDVFLDHDGDDPVRALFLNGAFQPVFPTAVCPGAPCDDPLFTVSLAAGTRYLGLIFEGAFSDVVPYTVRIAPHADEAVPPTLVQSNPAEGATVADTATAFDLWFSEPMDYTVTAVTLVGPGTTASVPVRWEELGDHAVVDVEGRLYTGAWKLDLDGLTDLSGNALDGGPLLGDGALDFTVTGDAPQVVGGSPLEGDVVGLGPVEVLVAFDKPMDTSITSVDGLVGDDGATLTVEWTTSRIAVLTGPSEPACASPPCDVTIDLSTLTDAGGTPLDGGPFLGDGYLDYTLAASAHTPCGGTGTVAEQSDATNDPFLVGGAAEVVAVPLTRAAPLTIGGCGRADLPDGDVIEGGAGDVDVYAVTVGAAGTFDVSVDWPYAEPLHVVVLLPDTTQVTRLWTCAQSACEARLGKADLAAETYHLAVITAPIATYPRRYQVRLAAGTSDFAITEVIDGDLPGGVPKIVELTNLGDDLVDLSQYELGLFTNGATTMSTGSFSLTEPVRYLGPGDGYVTLWENGDTLATNSMLTAYGFPPDDVGFSALFNGDDVIALYRGHAAAGTGADAELIDVFGVVGGGTTNIPWRYTDSYAARKGTVTAPSATFVLDQWTVGAAAALDAADDATRISKLQTLTHPGVWPDP